MVDAAEADGLVLAADVVASTDLPAFTSAAMDGWAVAGPPPWTVIGVVEAGAPPDVRLSLGQAVRISTGAPLPEGADAVLRHEDAHPVEPALLLVRETATPPAEGQHVRRAAAECRAGDVVAERGRTIVPAVLGLVAAAGADTLEVVRRPSVDVVVTGDELVTEGPARGAALRDALGPMLPAWLRRLGAGEVTVRHVDASAEALAQAVDASRGDLIVTSGSTSAGARDHLHAVLEAAGAQLVVDGVLVRPGHPMVMARLGDGRPLTGLPGNPLAAVSALSTLTAPVLGALGGHQPSMPSYVTLDAAVTGHPRDTRLVPVAAGEVVHHVGPAMLRGLTHADGLAVVPPGGAAAGDRLQLLPLP
jgi:molybdopterin molybdotransferase